MKVDNSSIALTLTLFFFLFPISQSAGKVNLKSWKTNDQLHNPVVNIRGHFWCMSNTQQIATSFNLSSLDINKSRYDKREAFFSLRLVCGFYVVNYGFYEKHFIY